MPREFTGLGEDASPPLRIQGCPPETKSLALIMDDPDAPSGIFTHWVVFDIPPGDGVFERNKVPTSARLGKNDFGRLVYGGPKPPSGEHRYFFHAYALDRLLALPEGSTRETVEQAMRDHILNHTKVMVHFARG